MTVFDLNDKEMVPIYCALLTLAGVLFSIYKNNSNFKKTVTQNNRKISLQHITDKRVDWIYAVREIVSEFIALSYWIANNCKMDKNSRVPEEEAIKINVLIAKMKLFFNFQGTYDKIILDLVDNINHNLMLKTEDFKTGRFIQDVESFTKYCQVYLKVEWERVKMETSQVLSENEKKEQVQIKKMIKDLEIQLYNERFPEKTSKNQTCDLE